jgi:CRP/FNR family transcriptional regulator
MIEDIHPETIRKISEPIKEDIYNVYSDGQIIFCEGEPGEELFIIKEGKVQISKFKNGTEIILSILKEGDIFGELAIVSDKPRNATAVCRSKTVLLPINLNSLSLLFEKSPGILKRIYTAISQRVWFSIIRLESKLYKKNLTKIYAFLENKLLEDNISLKSEFSHTMNFGIDELLKMNDISQEDDKNSIAMLLSDQNLNFNFGQISINKASDIRAMSSYYKTRDNIADSQEKGET